MAGSSSSSSRSGSWTDVEERHHSPIPYRVGPLEYYPPVLCKCRKKAALWISWSDENPGRRYYKCYRAREPDGCDFHGFYEGRHDSFVCSLLVDLRNAVWSLKRQRAALKDELQESANRTNELEKKVVECKQQVADARAGEAAMVETLHNMKKEKYLLRALCVAMAAMLVFLLAGKNVV